jgi:hypothetical protein
MIGIPAAIDLNRLVLREKPRIHRKPGLLPHDSQTKTLVVLNLLIPNMGVLKNENFDYQRVPEIQPFLLPSGKHHHNYGKSPFLMGKSTISMAMFNSYVFPSENSGSMNGQVAESWVTRSSPLTPGP